MTTRKTVSDEADLKLLEAEREYFQRILSTHELTSGERRRMEDCLRLIREAIQKLVGP
jgi:hypothetical protein